MLRSWPRSGHRGADADATRARIPRRIPIYWTPIYLRPVHCSPIALLAPGSRHWPITRAPSRRGRIKRRPQWRKNRGCETARERKTRPAGYPGGPFRSAQGIGGRERRSGAVELGGHEAFQLLCRDRGQKGSNDFFTFRRKNPAAQAAAGARASPLDFQDYSRRPGAAAVAPAPIVPAAWGATERIAW